jgi:hypothetical protein
MKKTLIISALLAGSLGAYAQGTVSFSDRDSDMYIHVYSPQANPAVEVTGNANSSVGIANDQYEQTGPNGYTGTSVGVIVTGGTTVYAPNSLIGNTAAANATAAGAFNFNNGKFYTVQLYAAPGFNNALALLSPVSQYVTTLTTSGTVGGTFPAVIPGSDPGIPNALNGGATIALYAWYNGTGATATGLTLAQAIANGDPWGVSPLDNLGALGGSGTPPNLATAPDMLGLQSFSLIGTPEPSTIALGVIGASTFLFRRRK